MLVRDLMERNVVTLHVSARLDAASGLMQLDRIRHLPVVDDQRRLVGIVSQRDLFRAGLGSLFTASGFKDHPESAEISLRELMTPDVVSVHPDASLLTAVRLMLDQRIGCLPVVEDDALVGILSERDCMHRLEELLAAVEERGETAS
jgi:CBS domain-containing protein